MFQETGLIGKCGELKVFLGGGSGIESPVDIDGNPIELGDVLSWNYGDSSNPKDWMYQPYFTVELHKSGKCWFGQGIDKEKRFYLHDFEFKNCKILEKFKACNNPAQT